MSIIEKTAISCIEEWNLLKNTQTHKSSSYVYLKSKLRLIGLLNKNFTEVEIKRTFRLYNNCLEDPRYILATNKLGKLFRVSLYEFIKSSNDYKKRLRKLNLKKYCVDSMFLEFFKGQENIDNLFLYKNKLTGKSENIILAFNSHLKRWKGTTLLTTEDPFQIVTANIINKKLNEFYKQYSKLLKLSWYFSPAKQLGWDYSQFLQDKKNQKTTTKHLFQYFVEFLNTCDKRYQFHWLAQGFFWDDLYNSLVDKSVVESISYEPDFDRKDISVDYDSFSEQSNELSSLDDLF